MALIMSSSPCDSKTSLPMKEENGSSTARSLSEPLNDRRNTLPSSTTGSEELDNAMLPSVASPIRNSNTATQSIPTMVANTYLKNCFIIIE